MLATFQNYFRANASGGCGFPSITLEGELADWKKILEKVWQLEKFGDAATEWSKLLAPIVRGIMVSYECPEVPAARDFWLKACYAAGRNGSGDTIGTLQAGFRRSAFGTRKVDVFVDILKMS